MNRQPNRLFRRPKVWQLPEGDWSAVQGGTFQGADAFLLASQRERLLLSSSGSASYTSEGRSDFFTEDGRMQRFEITSSSNDILLYSALSPRGKVKLLPRTEGNRVLHVVPYRDGGFSVLWTSSVDGVRSIRKSSVTASRIQNAEEDEYIAINSAHDVAQITSSFDPLIVFDSDYLLLWFTEKEEGLLPRFHLHIPSSESDPLFTRTRFLSYRSLPPSTRAIAAWKGPRIKALAQTPEGEVIYFEESRERGGEALRRELLSAARNVKFAEEDNRAWISWQDDSKLYWSELSLDGEIDPQEVLHFQEQEGYRVDHQIVFDDHKRPHLVFLEEDGEASLRSISLEDGSAKDLFDDERVGWKLHSSISRGGNHRGVLLLHKKEAVTFLPVNQSLPLGDDDNLDENMVQQTTALGPGRTWANMHNATSWGQVQFAKEKKAAGQKKGSSGFFGPRPGAWSGH